MNAQCPDGVAAARGMTCRSAVPGGCDKTEVCDGSSAVCPPDLHETPGTVCRPAVPGGCDKQEVCDGSANCPMDAHEASGTLCRAAVPGGCDKQEVCDGSASCPADAHQLSGTVCRPAVPGGCDKQEVCDGSANCPMDAHETPGTVCRPAVPGGCSQAATCDGSVTCPASAPQPDGFTCSDGNACTIGDVCMSGACMPGGPQLIGSPVDFGPGLVDGAPRPAMLTLDWRDTGSVSVTALTPSSDEFRISASQTFPIALSSSSPIATVAMEFVPSALGPRVGTITPTIQPMTCAVPTIALAGTGAPPGLAADPLDADFDEVEIGTTSPPRTFRVVNLSGAEVTIRSVTISDPVGFALTATGLPAALAVDAAYSFTVAARPQTTGRHDADIVVMSDSATAPMLTTSIHVDGTCVGGSCDPDPGSGSGSGRSERASYYACSTGQPSGAWPVLLALAFVGWNRRRRRPAPSQH
ncbi:MAG TPA: choice-of-anchor D domain-containing protein [Kofleriaceae bacterium]